MDKTQEYINAFLMPNTDLSPLEAYAGANQVPIVRSNVLQLLCTMVQAVKPNHILEIGTAIGYSGSAMLMHCNGHLTTIEKDPQSIVVAKQNFLNLGFQNRVSLIMGDALQVLKTLPDHAYEFVFLDGPKAQYVHMLNDITRCLTSGGVLFSDNVLFRGMVSGAQPLEPKKKGLVQRLHQFLQRVTLDGDYTTTVLPMDDGVSISVKNERNQ